MTPVAIAIPRVPDDLAELPRWSLWRNEADRKSPYCIDGQPASSTEVRDWGELELAIRALRTGRYTGLAFAFFAQDGLVGVDLDDCLDPAGTVKQWARGIVERFGDSYMEISPSGRGIKIWTQGS